MANVLLAETETAQPELKLWWAVIRQAAKDLRYGDRLTAEEALSFLADSGLWMLTEFYEFSDDDARRAIVALVAPRRDAGSLGASAALRHARLRTSS
jgi:hypothetical protein